MGFHFENDIDNREYWRLPDCLFIKINLAIDNADIACGGCQAWPTAQVSDYKKECEA
jgi:hypothetical protein